MLYAVINGLHCLKPHDQGSEAACLQVADKNQSGTVGLYSCFSCADGFNAKLSPCHRQPLLAVFGVNSYPHPKFLWPAVLQLVDFIIFLVDW